MRHDLRRANREGTGSSPSGSSDRAPATTARCLSPSGRQEPYSIARSAKVGRDSVAVEEFPATEWRATLRSIPSKIALKPSTLFRIGLLLLIATIGSADVRAQSPQPLRPIPNRQVVQAGAEVAEAPAEPQPLPAAPETPPLPGGLDVEQMLAPSGLTSTLKVMLLLTVISLAPSILIMTTCFIRFVIVFGLLRQAIGTQSLPPNQVLISLSLFLTFLVMAPVCQESYDKGIRPYTSPAAGEPPMTLDTAFQTAVRPLRNFMSDQIERAGNSDGVWMLLDYQRPDPNTEAGRRYRAPENYEEIPLSVLLPAYMLSELKIAFTIGFQLYLPFLVIDMVVASVLISMGMMMLPPVLISIPFKLLLFVMIDGWFLTVGMMLESVRPFG